MTDLQKEYDDFYQWYNKCPVKVLKHTDYVDTLEVIFELPYCEDELDE